MKLKLEELSAEGFIPFGQVVEQPHRPADAEGAGWTWWGENLLLAGTGENYAIGYLDLEPAPLCFDWAERHLDSDELVIPLGGDCVVYVAPPDYLDEPGRLPSWDRFQAFRVPSGKAVLLGKGVWHGAPLALGHPAKALVLLLHSTGQRDAHVVHFAEQPVEIER